MYTQCPDCATVFRVTAEALKIAQGDVRCGVCSTSFNALENLSEQAFKAAPASEDGSPDDSMTVEELPDSENIELSSPVELSVVPVAVEPEPEAAPEPDPEPEPEPEPEPVPVTEDENGEEQAMEFHGNAADLDRLFVIETPEVMHFDPGEQKGDLDSTDEHPILVLDEHDEPIEEAAVEAVKKPVEPPKPPLEVPKATSEAPRTPVEVPKAPVAVPPPPIKVPKAMVELPEEFSEPDVHIETIVLESEPSPAPAPPAPPASPARAESPTASHTAPRILIPDEMRRRLAEEAAARAAAAREFEPQQTSNFLSQRWPWVAGVSILAFLFLLQVVHSNRNDLVKSPALGPMVAGTYSFFGLSLMSPVDLAAYELHQYGAASDPNEANRLMLRASIVNRATYAQPFPLLRLVLQDRYGGTLGMRDIGPADYLPGAVDLGLLGPGERADALIRIVDPGTEAVGFELDICLPASGGVLCANQIKTALQ